MTGLLNPLVILKGLSQHIIFIFLSLLFYIKVLKKEKNSKSKKFYYIHFIIFYH